MKKIAQAALLGAIFLVVFVVATAVNYITTRQLVDHMCR
jgi:hypothetical protein